MITLCFEGEALPEWDSKKAEVTKKEGTKEVTKEKWNEEAGGRRSRRGINLCDFCIPAREWVSLGEFLPSFLRHSIVPQDSLAFEISGSQCV